MRSKLAVLTGALLVTGATSMPARGWQVSAEDHAKHHPAGQSSEPKAAAAAPDSKGMAGMDMMAANAKLDGLVKKMNAAQGQAKVDAIAALLTVMVQDHERMHGNMSGMMSMMKTMGEGHGK